MQLFEVCLHLKTPLVTTLTKTRGSTPRNYKVKKGLKVPKSSKYTNYFGRPPSFCFELIASKMLVFEICLALKEPLVVTFGETRPHTSRKSVAVPGINLTKSSKKHKLLRLHSSFFAFE